jgi:hypothetical protein
MSFRHVHEFNHIWPALTAFIFGDKGLRTVESLGSRCCRGVRSDFGMKTGYVVRPLFFINPDFGLSNIGILFSGITAVFTRRRSIASGRRDDDRA